MNVDLDDDERRLILNALSWMRLNLRDTLAGAGMAGIEGIDQDLVFSMGMSALDQVNVTANGVAEKLGGNPEAVDFGASAIDSETPDA